MSAILAIQHGRQYTSYLNAKLFGRSNIIQCSRRFEECFTPSIRKCCLMMYLMVRDGSAKG